MPRARRTPVKLTPATTGVKAVAQCGHEESVRFPLAYLGRVPATPEVLDRVRERKDEVIKSIRLSPCGACNAAETSALVSSEIALLSAAFDVPIPELNGTPKLVAFAGSLRLNFVTGIVRSISNCAYEMVLRPSLAEQIAMDAIKQRWGISVNTDAATEPLDPKLRAAAHAVDGSLESSFMYRNTEQDRLFEDVTRSLNSRIQLTMVWLLAGYLLRLNFQLATTPDAKSWITYHRLPHLHHRLTIPAVERKAATAAFLAASLAPNNAADAAVLFNALHGRGRAHDWSVLNARDNDLPGAITDVAVVNALSAHHNPWNSDSVPF